MIIKRAFAPKIKAKILSKWKKLSEDDLESISGRFNLLSSKIQNIYECSIEKAESECNEFRNAHKIR
jgi:uncharacterized protein YjbJ (UPF0337 family)